MTFVLRQEASSENTECDSSLVGKAPPCQGGDREFEPRLSLCVIPVKSMISGDPLLVTTCYQ